MTPDPTVMSTLTVSFPVIANVVPSKVKLPLSSSSPALPAITTLLSVKSLIFALSATKASIFAVPSMNRFCHSLPAAPMFLLPSVSGIKLLPIDVKVDTPDMFNLLLVVTPLTFTPCGVVWNTFPLS